MEYDPKGTNFKMVSQPRKILFEVYCGKDWRDKKGHIMRISNDRLRSWNMPLIEDENQLSSFIKFVEDEEDRLNNEFYIKSQKGEVDSKWTPAEKAKMPFRKVTEYVIGKTYHLSWAYKAAKFKLIKVLDDTYGLVDNPKYKRKNGPLKIKLADLRHIRTANIKN